MTIGRQTRDLQELGPPQGPCSSQGSQCLGRDRRGQEDQGLAME